MKTVDFAVLAAISLVVAACSFEHTEIQHIEITHYADDERNAKLAEELMYYDPRFLAHQIPAFNEETAKGIRLGYFIRSSDGQPSYRITYNRSIDAVSESLDELKSEFEAYVPMLAAKHASKEALFLELEPLGMMWINEFFSEEANTILEHSSSVLRDYITVAQLEETQNDLEAKFGSPTEIVYSRAQFYEQYDDVPESVWLFYETEMTGKSVFMIKVGLHETVLEWRVLGFGFQKIR